MNIQHKGLWLVLTLFLFSGCSTNPPVQEETMPAEAKKKETMESAQKKQEVWAWDYTDGPQGPTSWASLNPQYAMCASGQQQSPIDLVWSKPVSPNPLTVNYRPSEVQVSNVGYTMRIDFPPQNQIIFKGMDYLLEKVEFRTMSEHSLSGNKLPMEIQFYHRTSNGLKQAILSLLVIQGKESSWFNQVWKSMMAAKKFQASKAFSFDPSKLIPPRQTFYHYQGSLTHPPCLEGVDWFVFNTPLQLSSQQIGMFMEMFRTNNRPTQSLNGRKVTNF